MEIRSIAFLNCVCVRLQITDKLDANRNPVSDNTKKKERYMVNQLKEERNELARLDYRDWLSKTIDEIKGESGAKIFSVKKDPNGGRVRLIVDVHSLAVRLAKMKEIRLPLEQDERTYRATINMKEGCREVFGEKIQEIKTALSKRLISAIREALGASTDGENSENIIDELINSMLAPLDSMSREPSMFTWEFPRMSGLSSQELTLDSELDTPTFGSHKVTIEISNTTRFRELVQTALDTHIRFLNKEYASESDADYVINNVSTNIESMKTKGSDELSRLEKLINQETIGRLKREAQITYLEYWAKVIGEDCDNARESGQESKFIHQFKLSGEQAQRGISLAAASFYLRDYSRRPRLLEKFISDAKKSDSDYDVTYQGVTVNIRELFSRGDAFSELPIVGQIDGCIGETDDPQLRLTSITFGLKFKLNGRVNNPVRYDSSFAYALDIINPDSELHKTGLNETTQHSRKKHIEKIIKFFVLYYFAFACPNPLAPNYSYEQDIEFDVFGQFTEKILPILREQEPESEDDKKESDEKKQKLMRGFVKGMSKYLVLDKLKALVLTLKEYLKKEFVLSDEKEVNIGLSRGLLLSDLSEISNTDRFFNDDLKSENLKECLKYVFISPQAASRDAIVQFPVKLKFQTDNFYRTNKKCEFDMTYQTDGIQILPVFYSFVSNDAAVQFERDKENLQHIARSLGKKDNPPKNADEASDYMSRVVFPDSLIEFKVGEVSLEKATDRERFIYSLTLKTLGFIVMELLTSRVRTNNKLNKKLFVGQWILHETTEDKTTQQETVIHQMTEEWSHVLSDSMLINSQGIVMPGIDRFKVPNAKKSLYSVLPQEYHSKNNDKRTLDRLLIVMVSSNKCDARSSRWGENYIANLTGEIVAVEQTLTGSVKVSRVKTLVGNYWGDELHRSPEAIRDSINFMYGKGFRHVLYIANTPFSEHLRVTDQKNELYFMSPEIIKFLKDIADDLVIYPVLYDSYSALGYDNQINAETLYVQDVRQLSNVFNDPNRSQVVFFNLFTGKKINPETFYNRVTTYSTLLNAHPGDAIDVNKVMDGLIKEGQLKNDIMFYLTLFHYSKYEKQKTKREQLLTKLDPLNDIIGDNSIGRSSAKSQHCIPSVQMNYLAFLTEVYNALRVTSSACLDEIEDYLVKHEVSDPYSELPKKYSDCLVESHANPVLSQRVNAIIEPRGWVIEKGVVELTF